MVRLSAVLGLAAIAAVGMAAPAGARPRPRTAGGSAPAVSSPAVADVGATTTATATLDIQEQTDRTTVTLTIKTLGAPPTATQAHPVWLVNDQGLNFSTLWVDEQPGACAGEKPHVVPIGPAPYDPTRVWCLETVLPAHGSPVTGVLIGSDASITIHITHQADWLWPILAALLGLALAFVIVYIPDLTSALPIHRTKTKRYKSAEEESRVTSPTTSTPPTSRFPRGVSTLLAFVPMVVAGMASLTNQYLTNKTFGTRADYLGLFIVTAGTSTAAGAVTALFIKNPDQPAAATPTQAGSAPTAPTVSASEGLPKSN
jgi:hypothetical protein